MNKSFQLLILISVIVFSITGCKSKQKVVTIPNAHIEATNQPVETPRQEPAPIVVSQPEEVRDEKFTLDTEEKNTEVINQKYHVVVGSFKNRDNAKGLQQTLNSEGNNAVIVINEHGMYRVLIASYATYKEARSKIGQISNRFTDAWVLVQKQ